jgi:hypothetical protein
LRLAQRLHAAPSACADYYISVTPATTQGGIPRSGAAPGIRLNGAHAMPELRLPDMAAFAQQNGNDWYATGVQMRDLMVSAGFDVSKGDTWAINEVGEPSDKQMAVDVFNGTGSARTDLERFVDGLYTGEPGMPTAPGLIFVANPSQITTDLAAYKHGLDAWYQDGDFWNAMKGKVRFWAQETYADARNWGVAGSTLDERTAHLDDYLEHALRFAQVDPKASSAARDFLATAYTPVGNSSWPQPAPELNAGGIGYGFTNISLPLMQNFVSSQTYAARGAGDRLGFAWWVPPLSPTRPPATSYVALADRIAASIAGSDSDPLGACSPDLSWCDGSVDGAAFTEAWKTFSDSTPPVLTVPDGVVADATGPDGSVVTYDASAVDLIDPAPVVECTPPSGSQFAIGTTTVTCTATDDTGNVATASFDVHVEDALEQLGDLADSVRAADLSPGLETALEAKLEAASNATGQDACVHLAAFERLVANAERVGHLSGEQGGRLVADAERISAVIACD